MSARCRLGGSEPDRHAAALSDMKIGLDADELIQNGPQNTILIAFNP
jgi:hypothetical protein